MITLNFSADNSAQSRLFVDYCAISIRVEQIARIEFQVPNKGSRCTMHPSNSTSPIWTESISVSCDRVRVRCRNS